MNEPYANPEPPEFDEDRARQIIGKRVLVGVTYRDRDSHEVLRLEQFHGVVARASRKGWIVVRWSDDTERSIPPDLSKLEPAASGNYRLKSTGEIVVDPDYLSVWTVYPKKDP
ncbi:MAG: hypothetical protein LBI48_04280 [Burkholderiaceae bacterium]|jgi:hypothetical protein|nr:hypothetical protein [Burkholderiaceae bacterium]